MQRYEYKAVPAPARAEKVKGLKRGNDRFAHSLSSAMNAMAAEGWEYIRADTLPCEERKGLMGGTTTHYYTLLIFRRALPGVQPEAPATAMIADQRATAVQESLQRPEPVAPRPDGAAHPASGSMLLRAERTVVPGHAPRISLVNGSDQTPPASIPRIGPAADGPRD